MTITPRTMTAVLLNGLGGFEQLEVRDDVPVPEPVNDEVLLQVLAAGVNNTDINTRIGWYAKGPNEVGWSGDLPTFPRIQGADACGRIVAVGASVDPRRVGERVIVEPVLRRAGIGDRPAYFGSEIDGAFAECTVVPAKNAVRVDCGWSDVELASIPCSYSAAENMIDRTGVGHGESVIVTGASGGVGTAAVQLAKRRGAHVTALAAAAKHAEIEALGADVVLPRDVDLASALGPRCANVVIDVVGGAAWPQLLAALRPGGRYATSGAIAGPLVELDLRTLYLEDLTLFGCTVLGPGVFANLVRYIERGEIRPVVAATFPLHEIVAAQQLFLTKQHVGKIVLTLPPSEPSHRPANRP